MRVVLDTNVLISALLISKSAPAQLINFWRRGAFDLLTCELQVEALRQITRRESVRDFIRPALAGEIINQLRSLSIWIETLPCIDSSPDPFDNSLLSLAQGGKADVLVSGDKNGVLNLQTHEACRIITVRQFLDELESHQRTK